MGYHPGMNGSEAGALPFEFKMSPLMNGFDEPESLQAPMDLPMNLDKIGSDLLNKPYDLSDNANTQLNDLLDNIKASLSSPMPSAYNTNSAFPGGLYTDPLFQSTPSNPIPSSFMSDAPRPPSSAVSTANSSSLFQPSEQTMFADIAKPGSLFQNIPQMAPSDPMLQNSFPQNSVGQMAASFSTNPLTHPAPVCQPAAPMQPAGMAMNPMNPMGMGMAGKSMMTWNGQKLSRQYMECRKPKILFDPVYNRTVAVAFACSACHRAKKRCIGGGIGKSCRACAKKGLTCKPRTDKRSHHSRLYSPMLTPPERAAFRRQRMIAQRMKQRARKSIVRMPRSLLKMIGPVKTKVEHTRQPPIQYPKVELPGALGGAGAPAFKVQLPNTLNVQLPNSLPTKFPTSNFAHNMIPNISSSHPKVQLFSPASPEE